MSKRVQHALMWAGIIALTAIIWTAAERRTNKFLDRTRDPND